MGSDAASETGSSLREPYSLSIQAMSSAVRWVVCDAATEIGSSLREPYSFSIHAMSSAVRWVVPGTDRPPMRDGEFGALGASGGELVRDADSDGVMVPLTETASALFAVGSGSTAVWSDPWLEGSFGAGFLRHLRHGACFVYRCVCLVSQSAHGFLLMWRVTVQ